jgi:hypothetical protein
VQQAQHVSRVVVKDGAGDVWKAHMRTSGWTRVDRKPAADERRGVVRHGHSTVVVRWRFVNLRQVGVARYQLGIVVPHGDYAVELVARPAHPAGHATLYPDWLRRRSLPCRNLSHRVDYTADMVLLRVPRSCLDTPHWVRANLGNMLVKGQAPHRRHFVDNAHNDDPYSNFPTRRLYRR